MLLCSSRFCSIHYFSCIFDIWLFYLFSLSYFTLLSSRFCILIYAALIPPTAIPPTSLPTASPPLTSNPLTSNSPTCSAGFRSAHFDSVDFSSAVFRSANFNFVVPVLTHLPTPHYLSGSMKISRWVLAVTTKSRRGRSSFPICVWVSVREMVTFVSEVAGSILYSLHWIADSVLPFFTYQQCSRHVWQMSPPCCNSSRSPNIDLGQPARRAYCSAIRLQPLILCHILQR